MLFENGFHFCDGDLLLLLKSCFPPLSILRRFSPNEGDLISGVGEGRFDKGSHVSRFDTFLDLRYFQKLFFYFFLNQVVF